MSPNDRQTLGEERVRKGFNPRGDKLVDDIKHQSAELIDLCAAQDHGHGDSEASRLWALAMTAFEEGAMWAVKAATS